MKKTANLFALFGTVFVLLVFMVWLRTFEFGTTETLFHPKSLAATGFIILAAFSMGEFFRLINVPALLGYIAAGVLFGPNLAPMLPNEPDALFSLTVIDNLALINVLTIGVIGTLGGGELKIAEIKENFTTILAIFSCVFILVFSGTFVTVLIVTDHFPALLPFLEGRSRENVYAAAILFGIFGAAMSPAAVLAILQETRAKGQISSLTLSTVIIADLTLVAMVLLGIQLAELLISPEGFTTAALVDAMPSIAAEFGLGLVIGIAAGLVFILYLRFVKRELMLFTVAMIFVTAYAAKVFHAETLLAFLTAGFVVQNFSKQGHDMIHALEKISLPVFVIYFMIQAAQLDLASVADYVWITLILAGLRLIAFFVGSRVGAEFVGANPTVRRYLWLGFFSLAGVDLVLAAMVADAIGPWGAEFQTVIMAQVIVHITIGPPLLKLGLDRAGETEGSRRETQEEAQAFDELPAMADAESIAASFPLPAFTDETLNDRVLHLRSIIVDVHREQIVEPLEEKIAALETSLQNAAEELDAALTRVEVILSSDEFESAEQRADAVARSHIAYLADIADNVDTWEAIIPEIIHHQRVFELIIRLRDSEDFTSVHRVPREDFLFEPSADDPMPSRLLKMLRRARRSLFGRGQRSIPLGRLWRYYVELATPRLLARAAGASATENERFWTDLGNHTRRVDDLFDDLFDAVLAGADERASGEEKEPAPESNDAVAADEEETSPKEGGVSPVEVLAEGRAAIERREQALREQLATSATTALDRYTVGLREAYSRFLSAAARAGTVELPAWKYRPSAQFDRAQRAEAQIEQRLRREQTVVTGQRGWIVTEYQLVLFLHWLDTYEHGAREILDAMIATPVTSQLEALRDVCKTLPDELSKWGDLESLRDALPDAETADAASAETSEARDVSWPEIEWEHWLNDAITPAIDQTRTRLQRILALYGQGRAARRLLEILERRVAKFSNEIVLLSEHPDEIDPTAVVPTLRIPLREWFISEVVRETALRLVEFDERGEAAMYASLETLEDIQQVLEFNLRAAAREAEEDGGGHAIEVATGGLERAARMVDDLRASYLDRFHDLTTWVVEETSAISELAAEPFLEHRPAEIERLLGRRSQATLTARGENLALSITNRVASSARDAYGRYAPVAQEIAHEVGTLFVEETPRIENTDIRGALHPDERDEPQVPAVYRRLFTPLPLDIPDFFVPQPEVEGECRRIISEWVDGRPHSLLVFSDRGMGKRSTLHHILQHEPAMRRTLGDVEVHTVLLEDDLQTETEIVSRLGSVLPGNGAESFEELTRSLEGGDDRHVIVIEHGEKLYSRTAEGLVLCRRFLRLMSTTSGRFLWVVMMGTPAVRFLDTAIGLRDFFTHSVELKPLDERGIEQMIQARHRVSGFRARWERPGPRVRDWLRHPIDTSEAMRDPRSDYFRELTRRSDGNPKRALLHWLESVSIDDEDDHLIWVKPLSDREPMLVGKLSLTKKLILTALVQHRTLTPMQLRAILRRDFDAVQTELDHLERLGFVEKRVGPRVTAYQIRGLASNLVTRELRQMNMI